MTLLTREQKTFCNKKPQTPVYMLFQWWLTYCLDKYTELPLFLTYYCLDKCIELRI